MTRRTATTAAKTARSRRKTVPLDTANASANDAHSADVPLDAAIADRSSADSAQDASAPAAPKRRRKAPAAETAAEREAVKPRRRKRVERDSMADKLVRDRFTMPAADYDLIKLLKKRAEAAGRPTKKNELLRAGLHALRESGSVELVKSLERLMPVRRKGKAKDAD